MKDKAATPRVELSPKVLMHHKKRRRYSQKVELSVVDEAAIREYWRCLTTKWPKGNPARFFDGLLPVKQDWVVTTLLATKEGRVAWNEWCQRLNNLSEADMTLLLSKTGDGGWLQEHIRGFEFFGKDKKGRLCPKEFKRA